jgi:MFS family permease
MTLSQALIGENVAPRQRARFQGYFAALFATSSTLGPVLGALLTQQFGWRAIFLVNLPLGVVAAALALRIPRGPPPEMRHSRLDSPGIVLLALGTVSLFFALSSAGHRLPWTDLRLYGLLAFATICLGALVMWERRTTHPVLPVQLLASPIIWRSNATVMCFAAALFASILYLPLYLQLGRGVGIGESGLLLLPLTLSIAAASGLTGRAISRTGRLNAYAKIGLSVSTVTLLALAATVSIAPTAAILALTVIAGAGLGTVMAPTQLIVQSASGNARLGAAVASISVSRSIGGSLGVAIVGALLFVLVGNQSELLATVLPQLAESGGAGLASLSEAQRSEIAANLDGAFRVIFFVIAAFAGAGAVIASTVPAQRL